MKQELSFEESLDALERTVERMESGELSLEQSLQAFEHGIALTRQCQQALDSAQNRISQLLEQNGKPVQQPLTGTPAAATTDNNEEDIPF